MSTTQPPRSDIPAKSREILLALLTNEEYWIWEGKKEFRRAVKLRKDALMGAYWNRIMGEWVEEVYLGQLLRAYQLLFILKSSNPNYVDHAYVENHFSYVNLDGQNEIHLDCEDCEMTITQSISMGKYSLIWSKQHPEWYILDHYELEDWLNENAIPPETNQMRMF